MAFFSAQELIDLGKRKSNSLLVAVVTSLSGVNSGLVRYCLERVAIESPFLSARGRKDLFLLTTRRRTFGPSEYTTCGKIAAYASNMTVREREWFLVQSQQFGFWAEVAAAHAPDLTVSQRKELMAYSNDRKRCAREIAVFAPNLTDQERDEFFKISSAG